MYETENGTIPFEDWLASLKGPKTRNFVEKRLMRLQEGNPGDCKYFEDMMEMRIDHGPGYRINCGKEGKTLVILLIGGAKKGQDRDIEKAKRYWADYKKRISRIRAIRELPLPRPKE
jgi:putative addiction module killer protein